jgi:hypothetical protein
VRKALVAASLLGLVVGLLLVPASGAVFTSSCDSLVGATADCVQNWLHLYSQATDPNGLTGYYLENGTTNPAATGADNTLSVRLGTVSVTTTVTANRVLTLATVSVLPIGSSVTVTATLQSDPNSGIQPITAFGFAPIGNTGTSSSVTLSAGAKYQANLKFRVSGMSRGQTCYPKVVITLKYSGLTATFYQYVVTLSVTRQ